jgi:hypothetical protein
MTWPGIILDRSMSNCVAELPAARNASIYQKCPTMMWAMPSRHVTCESPREVPCEKASVTT